MDLETWEYYFHPYAQLNSSNELRIRIFKKSNICTASISWVGSTNQDAAVFEEISIPEKFRPPVTVRAYTPAIVGTITHNTGTRITINPDGTVSFDTNTHSFVERLLTLTYVC